MALSLLATKIQVPQPPNHMVERPTLIHALDQALLEHKLILISAPAGYGKTTLLSQWARSRPYSTAWLTIEESDNDLDRFYRYLLEAWKQVRPKIIESQLGKLLGAMSPDIDAVLAAFINEASLLADHMTFILDDYHLIAEPSIHTAMAYLLDHLPSKFHFVLAGRGEPPLPLARYRAHGEMADFHSRDLRFSGEETADFLNEQMGLALSPEEIAQLQTQLEGWIASLQLVSLTLRQGLLEAEEITVSGRQRFIADYLTEDVFGNLAEEMQQFLLETSILEGLCGSLCDAVTGADGGGQEMLEALEKADLFIVPLDNRREWFRYHRLFADFLYETLMKQQATVVPTLHQRAGEWYLANDLPDEAMRHATAGDDGALVIRILERHLQPMLIGGEFTRLKRWLDSLPESWYTDYPRIGLFQTGFLLFTGQLEASVQRVKSLEANLASAQGVDSYPQLARVKAMQCSIACFQDDLSQAEVFANQAFQGLPEEDYFFRAIIYGSLGDTYRRHGRWGEARACYVDMLDFIYTPAFRLQSTHVFGALADLELRQGNLKAANGYWREALAVIQERNSWGRLPLPLIGWVFIRLAELLYEWNELTEASEHLRSGLERAELGGDVRAMIAGYLIAGRLELTKGNIDVAERYLEQTRPLIQQAHFSHWRSRFERLQLELWLAQKRLRTAVLWAEGKLSERDRADEPENIVSQLVTARVLIAKGDNEALAQALRLLRGLRRNTAETGRMGLQIEALALHALAYDKQGETANALSELLHALRLAEPEGYIRCFVDMGSSMARLLQKAHARQVMPDYTGALLAAFDNDAAPTQRLPEPLTERELEVLDLLAAGLTNSEIAEKLVISAGTVKKHASNIYGKLGVSGRTEAAARARELDLLH